MHVLGFAASPRLGGNSEILLDEVIKGLLEGGIQVEKIRTHELNFSPCKSCGECSVTGRCVIDDQFQNLYHKLITCDGLVFSTPLYFMNVPAGGKTLIDRCQVFWAARYHAKLDLFGGRKRFGLLVACSGAGYGPGKSPVFRGLEDTMTYVFKALRMEVMPSLLFPQVEGKGAILSVPSALENAYKAGRQLAEKVVSAHHI